MTSIPQRFLREVGTRASLRIYWGDDCKAMGFHNAEVPLVYSDKLDEWTLGGDVADYQDDRWPTKCDGCGLAVPPLQSVRCCDDPTCGRMKPAKGSPIRQIFRTRVYEAADGVRVWRTMGPDAFKPGDLHYVRWHEPGQCHHGWTNCDGNHLVCYVPGGPTADQWDIDGRASNCGSPNDTTHRCWVRNGDPSKGELVHVDKGPRGHISSTTCTAGAGSIGTPRWHGFLHRGILHT